MHFKGFRIGKPKEKNENIETKNTTTTQTAVLEKPLSGSTNNLKQHAKQLKKLSDKSVNSEENADISARPHGPIGELEVGAEDELKDKDSPTDENDGILPEESGEEVKLVEVSADVVTSLKAKAATSPKAEAAASPKAQAAALPKAQAAIPPKAEAASPPKEDKTKLEDAGDSLNKLFSNDEEEENPLANLIRSMPDVTTEELLDDLNEIKEIIREWQQK
jgi:hypothetical protein